MKQFGKNPHSSILNGVNNRYSFTSMFDASDWLIAIVVMVVFSVALQLVNN